MFLKQCMGPLLLGEGMCVHTFISFCWSVHTKYNNPAVCKFLFSLGPGICQETPTICACLSPPGLALINFNQLSNQQTECWTITLPSAPDISHITTTYYRIQRGVSISWSIRCSYHCNDILSSSQEMFQHQDKSFTHFHANTHTQAPVLVWKECCI